jgi:hypothetical protein
MTEVGRMNRGELMGSVLADEHTDGSRDAVCCLAQQRREAEVTAAAGGRYGQRNPGPDRAATRPHQTPQRPQPFLSQHCHPFAALSQTYLRDFRQSRQSAIRRREELG